MTKNLFPFEIDHYEYLIIQFECMGLFLSGTPPNYSWVQFRLLPVMNSWTTTNSSNWLLLHRCWLSRDRHSERKFAKVLKSLKSYTMILPPNNIYFHSTIPNFKRYEIFLARPKKNISNFLVFPMLGIRRTRIENGQTFESTLQILH